MRYNKVIFVCEDNLCRSPVAEAIMKSVNRCNGLTIESRGLIVLFPEPYNPKAASLLRNNGIILGNGESRQLEDKDMGKDVLILAVDSHIKEKLSGSYPGADNVYTIAEFAGAGEDVPDPYGADMEAYTKFYEQTDKLVKRAADRIYTIDTDNKEEL